MAILPNKNLKDSEVRDTLNKGGGKTDNDFWTKYKLLSNVNIWSFRKPYATDLDLFYLTDEQIRSINCGLTPLQIASPTSLPGRIDGKMNGWAYEMPTGGQSSPFRSGDYLGYNPDAQPMIQNLSVPAQVSIKETGSIAITAIVIQQDGVNVSLADLGELADCKGAVYMVNEALGQTRIIEGTALLSSGVFNVEVPISEFLVGDWIVYPYITTGYVHYTIPYLNRKTINVIDSVISVSVKAIKSTDGSYSISWEARVYNKSMQDITFNNNNVKLRYSGYGRTDIMQDGEKQVRLLDGLVAKGESTTTVASGVFENVSTVDREWDDGIVTSIWKNPIIWVELGSAAYWGSGVPMMEME